MLKRSVLAVCVLAFTGLPCVAGDVRLGPYRNPETEGMRNVYRTYLDGVKGGLMAANAWQQAFCLPEHLALTIEQAEDIVLASAKKRAAKDDWFVASLLLSGLQDACPCEQPAAGTDVRVVPSQ
jgi:hypothetical protein